MESPREQAHRIQSELQKSPNPEVDAVRKLLQLKVQDAKDKLVDAMGEDIIRFQGEARAYKKLLDDMTWKPDKIEGAKQ